MKYTLGLKRHFDAAHFLKNYRGKCASIHGHRWEVEVIVEGEDLDEIGMLVDFTALKNMLDGLLEQLDHKLLNEQSLLEGTNPTAEHLCRVLYRALENRLPCGTVLKAVKIWETPDAWAMVSR